MDRPAPKAARSNSADQAVDLKHDPYAALRIRNYRLYMIGNFLSILGLQMQSAAVAREVYQRTHEPISLAYIGLVQVLPVLGLAIFAGHVADRFNRRYIVMTALLVISSGSAGLAIISALHADVRLMYGCLFVAGLARAFQQPAKASFLPHLVPRKVFTNAVTWNAAAFQFASVLGPAAAGILIGIFNNSAVVYACDASFALCFCAMLSQVRYRPRPHERQPFTFENLLAGLRFVWLNKIVLAASSLDMFGVLFGAAVALLPIYAEDILHVGSVGYGVMMAAPAAGAVLMSFVLSYRPPMTHAGRSLLLAVIGFGAATIVFGISTWFPLSLAMLFMVGAMDNVSVVVRQSMIQLLTPDHMRGRVSAVNGMFISISNEVGDIESGTVAQAFGAKFSAISGGLGTLAVVGIVAWLFPQLRRFGKLDGSVVAQTLAPIPAHDAEAADTDSASTLSAKPQGAAEVDQ
jgi:MFS family permease